MDPTRLFAILDKWRVSSIFLLVIIRFFMYLSKDLSSSGLVNNLFTPLSGFKSLETCCNWLVSGINE